MMRTVSPMPQVSCSSCAVNFRVRFTDLEYFGCFFPAKIVSVGYRALLDPNNERVRS